MSSGHDPDDPGRHPDLNGGDDPRWQPPPPDPATHARDSEVRRNPQLGRDPRWGRDPDPEALRPLNLGDVLDGMFRVAGRHWQAFAIALSVIVVPLALLSSVALFETTGSFGGSFFEAFQDSVTATGAPPDPATVMRAGSSAALSGLVTLLLTPLIYGVAVQVAARGYRDGEVDALAAVRTAARRYLALLGAGFLIWVAAVLAGVALPLVVGLVFAVLGAEASVALPGVGLAAMLGIVVAIVVAVRLSLAVPVIIVERAGAVDALRRSNQLVRGDTARIFGILLVVGIIVTIIALVVSVPFQLGLLSGSAIGVVVATVGSIINNLLTYSLMAVAFVLLYFDRRVRTEGYDLSELARELGQESRPPW